MAEDVHAPDLVVRVLGGLFGSAAPPLRDVLGVDEELACRELGARVGGRALAQLGVRVDVSGGEELAGPLQRFEVLLGLDAVDQLAVDEVPAERLLTAREHTEGLEGGPLHVEAGPPLGLGVGDLLAQRHELVGRGGDFVPLLVEDVLAVQGHDAGDVRGRLRQAAQLAAEEGALPGVRRDRREVRVLLDRVPGEVRAEVRELADDGAGYLAAHVPAGDDHDVRDVAGGQDRAELLVVGVAVLVLPLDVDTDQVVHRLVVGIVRLRRGPPERRHDADLAALAELLRHRGLQAGDVELAGEADRGAVLGGDVRGHHVGRDVVEAAASWRSCPPRCPRPSRCPSLRRRRAAASLPRPPRRRPPWRRGSFSGWERRGRRWRCSASLRQPFVAHSRTPGGGAVGCGVLSGTG